MCGGAVFFFLCVFVGVDLHWVGFLFGNLFDRDWLVFASIGVIGFTFIVVFLTVGAIIVVIIAVGAIAVGAPAVRVIVIIFVGVAVHSCSDNVVGGDVLYLGQVSVLEGYFVCRPRFRDVVPTLFTTLAGVGRGVHDSPVICLPLFR